MLPEVAHKVIQITNDPDSDASQLIVVFRLIGHLQLKLYERGGIRGNSIHCLQLQP